MKNRRKYDNEFKQMAIELRKHRNDLSGLAAELEIRPELLYRWRREFKESPGASFPKHGNPRQTEEEKEIARLKKELRETQLERDIFKKTVSIFSKSDGKYSSLLNIIAPYFPLRRCVRHLMFLNIARFYYLVISTYEQFMNIPIAKLPVCQGLP